jgi:hypothetical protein
LVAGVLLATEVELVTGVDVPSTVGTGVQKNQPTAVPLAVRSSGSGSWPVSVAIASRMSGSSTWKMRKGQGA